MTKSYSGSTYQLLVFISIFLLAPNLEAAQIGLDQARGVKREFDDEAHIYIDGSLEVGDVNKFKGALTQYTSLKSHLSPMPVLLNSPGGDVSTAIEIGIMIRNASLETVILERSECNSSCVFLFASGVRRMAFGDNQRIGLHRPTFTDSGNFSNLPIGEARRRYDTIVNHCEKFLKKMGIGARVIEDMMATSSHEVKFPTRTYLKDNNLIGDDPAYWEWDRAKQANQWPREQLRTWDEYHRCINLSSNLSIDEQFKQCDQETGFSSYNWDITE